MGGVVSAGVDNDDLVDKLKGEEYIRTPMIEKVFRLVDRAEYITQEDKGTAYKDNAWRSGNLHLSAPCIYAQAMEGLQISEGMSFLNIGSGTGYLSTMAGLLLGPKGISHGIELHSDVIEYAYEHLEKFKTYSGALDVLDFCDPIFIQGNAFCLPDDKLLYDRVYCGAACFDSHEKFIKRLLKIDGILVMPLNDQLLKITRIGPVEWKSESLLPVTFSPLVIPDPTHPPATLQMPFCPLDSLQNLCRRKIRKILHQSIENDHPELKSVFTHEVKSTRSRREVYPGMRMLFPDLGSDQDDTSDTSDSQDISNTPFESHRQVVNNILELRRSLVSRINLRNVDHCGLIRRLNPRPIRSQQENEANSTNNDVEMAENTGSQNLSSSEKENMDIETDQELETSEEEFDSCKELDMHFIPKESHTESTVDQATHDSPSQSEPENASTFKENQTSLLKSIDENDPKIFVKPTTSDATVFPSTSIAAPSVLPSTSTQKHSDEEDDSLSTHSNSSNSSNKRSRDGESSQDLEEPKKREKFDSGVGDEIEGSATTTPGDSTEGDDEADSDDSMLKIISLRERRFHPRPTLRQVTRRRMQLSTPSKEPKQVAKPRDPKQNPVIKYSFFMREKIDLLPLPLSMKVFINNNRDMEPSVFRPSS